MTYALPVFVHAVAAAALGVALAAIWLADERARRTLDAERFVRARRRVARFERLVVPAVLVLLATGVWLVWHFYGSGGVMRSPWLAGMVALFALQSTWARAVTVPHAARLERLAAEALETGRVTPALAAARTEPVPTFGHFVELPVYLLIVALGLLKPVTWAPVVAGIAAVLVAAALATFVTQPLPRRESAGLDTSMS